MLFCVLFWRYKFWNNNSELSLLSAHFLSPFFNNENLLEFFCFFFFLSMNSSHTRVCYNVHIVTFMRLHVICTRRYCMANKIFFFSLNYVFNIQFILYASCIWWSFSSICCRFHNQRNGWSSSLYPHWYAMRLLFTINIYFLLHPMQNADFTNRKETESPFYKKKIWIQYSIPRTMMKSLGHSSSASVAVLMLLVSLWASLSLFFFFLRYVDFLRRKWGFIVIAEEIASFE